MKVVIYYEGPSEKKMLNHFLYKSYKPIKLTEDYTEFLSAPSTQNIILLYDCEGYQNVFPNIDSTPHYYANNERIIIIRDLERTNCFRLLKDELYEYCPKLPRTYARPIFVKYKLEHLYLADLNIFKRVFRKMYNDNFRKQIPDNNRFEELIRSLDPTKPDFKGLFKAYNMAFPKSAIANEFFARFDFLGSNHPYFERLFESLKEIVHL